MLLDAFGANVDASLVRSLPSLDLDDGMSALHADAQNRATRISCAASPSNNCARQHPTPQPTVSPTTAPTTNEAGRFPATITTPQSPVT